LFKQPSSNKFQAEKMKSLKQTCSNFQAEKTTPWNSQGSSSSRQEKLLDKNNKLVSRQREREREEKNYIGTIFSAGSMAMAMFMKS
jgi:hypothetical protein